MPFPHTRRAFIRDSSLAAAALALHPLPLLATETPGVAVPDAVEGLSHARSARGDLRLPPWGPYTKAYAGVSHIPDATRGVRFDLSVFPGLYRRRQPVPTVTSDSGFYPWRAAPDLGSYTFRHALADLETFYADLTYTMSDGGVTIDACFVNATAREQQASLHFLASLNFPERGPGRQPALHAAEVRLPPGGAWLDATGYETIAFGEDDPKRHLPDNAEIWGEVRRDGCVHGTALGRGFGGRRGESVCYRLPDNADVGASVALMRAKVGRGQRVVLRAAGAFAGAVTLEGADAFQCVALPKGNGSVRTFTLEVQETGALEIDGFAIVPQGRREEVSFVQRTLEYRPRLIESDVPDRLLLAYEAVEGCYGIAWKAPASEVREWLTDQLERDFPLFTHDHVRRVIDCGGQRHFANVFVRPIFLRPGETKRLAAFVTHGASAEAVAARLDRSRTRTVPRPEASGGPAGLFASNPSGERYRFGIERLAATVATNVVYPVRRLGRFVRHYTPGRWWDSLYTWDSGFIGLGLLELDPERSIDNLAAYLAEPDEPCAFVHHGSPLPVQIYQLQALWNRTQDPAVLRRFFPGARRMHRFLVGRSEGSNTRRLASGLLSTWSYFYNSGGWDDYPPQRFVQAKGLAGSVAPVVNSAHAIRTGRLLREMGRALGEPTEEFDADIEGLTAALQRHAWNPGSGWFSYVRHDDLGHPLGPLLHSGGEDFNRGLDGLSPLIAGICTPEQESRFLARLKDERVFWTPCGLSTVDRSASYFSDSGYWNGAVWMPHQWFIWKTLLDLGEAEFAWRIASTALSVWEEEVRATGCCFEHFVIETGRGAGWHHFGGLSSPLLNWFSAYFRPGTLTGGFDCWIEAQTFDRAAGSLRARLRFSGERERKRTVLAVLPETRRRIRARWNGADLPAIERVPGAFEIQIPSSPSAGELLVGETVLNA